MVDLREQHRLLPDVELSYTYFQNRTSSLHVLAGLEGHRHQRRSATSLCATSTRCTRLTEVPRFVPGDHGPRIYVKVPTHLWPRRAQTVLPAVDLLLWDVPLHLRRCCSHRRRHHRRLHRSPRASSGMAQELLTATLSQTLFLLFLLLLQLQLHRLRAQQRATAPLQVHVAQTLGADQCQLASCWIEDARSRSHVSDTKQIE